MVGVEAMMRMRPIAILAAGIAAAAGLSEGDKKDLVEHLKSL